MKKVFTLIFLVLPIFVQAQETEYESLNQLLTQNLRFPKAELYKGNASRVILSLKIDEEGLPDSVFLIENGGEEFNAEVIRVTNMVIENWNLKFLEDRKPDNEYLIVANFRTTSEKPTDYSSRFERYLEKKKYDKAIELATEQAETDPFNHYWYEKRSEVYKAIGNIEEYQRDYISARRLKNKVLISVDITAIGIERLQGQRTTGLNQK